MGVPGVANPCAKLWGAEPVLANELCTTPCPRMGDTNKFCDAFHDYFGCGGFLSLFSAHCYFH